MKAVAWAIGAAALLSVLILALPTQRPAQAEQPILDRESVRSSGGAADEKARVAIVVSGKDGRTDKIRIGF